MTLERTLLLFLLEVTAKATALVGVAGLACWMLGRASAAARHFIWAVALAGVLALPMLALLLPDWRVALLPALRTVEVSPASPALKGRATEMVSPALVGPPMRRAAANRQIITSPDHHIAKSPDREIASSPDHQITKSPLHQITTSPDRQMSLSLALLALWIAGVLLALGRFLAGHLRLWWIERHTEPITDPAWIDLSRRVAHQLRLRIMVRLLRCRRPTMPVCWGVRRPSLLLPSDADTWTVERRQIVLLHELAHAKRRDCLTQAIAQLAIALHWFNPFVWMAVRRLRAERERACDDVVLAAGASASDYADHLLDIARAFRTAGYPSWAAVAMARPSQLEGRLLAILDRHRDRRGLTRRACAAAAALALAMVGTLAAVQPTPGGGGPPPLTPGAGGPPPLRPGGGGAPPLREVAAATDARSPSSAVSDSRSHPTLADAPGTATVAVSPFGQVQPAPAPAPKPDPDPRPVVIPKVDLDIDDLDLEAELEAMIEGVAGGVAGGVVGGVVGGVLGGVAGGIKHLAVDNEFIALQAARGALAGIVQDKVAKAADADPRIVAALTTALKDESPAVRRQAAMTLSQMRGPQIADALLQATTDSDPEVRQFAVMTISRYKSDAVTKALARALKDSSGDVRQAAMHGISRLRDPQFLDALIEAVKDAEPDVRQQAVHGLAQLRDARAVPALITALEDANADVRQQAAHALGQIGDVRAVDALTAALKDVEDEVREQVVHALGQIGRRAQEGARGRGSGVK